MGRSICSTYRVHHGNSMVTLNHQKAFSDQFICMHPDALCMSAKQLQANDCFDVVQIAARVSSDIYFSLAFHSRSVRVWQKGKAQAEITSCLSWRMNNKHLIVRDSFYGNTLFFAPEDFWWIVAEMQLINQLNVLSDCSVHTVTLQTTIHFIPLW